MLPALSRARASSLKSIDTPVTRRQDYHVTWAGIPVEHHAISGIDDVSPTLPGGKSGRDRDDLFVEGTFEKHGYAVDYRLVWRRFHHAASGSGRKAK